MDSSTTTTSTTTSTSTTSTLEELDATCYAMLAGGGCESESLMTIYDELCDEKSARERVVTSRGQVEFDELRRAFYTYLLAMEVLDSDSDPAADTQVAMGGGKRKGCDEPPSPSKEQKLAN